MRTIKFRGKRVDNEEWVYGDLVHITTKEGVKGTLIIHETQVVGETTSEEATLSYSRNEVSVVFPDTVGQFTGRLDKNGKDIYEGDVLQRIPNEQYSDATGIPLDMLREDIGEGGDMVFVRYDESQARVMYYSLIDRFNSPWLNTKYFTVIGNIHDNPELLTLNK